MALLRACVSEQLCAIVFSAGSALSTGRPADERAAFVSARIRAYAVLRLTAAVTRVWTAASAGGGGAVHAKVVMSAAISSRLSFRNVSPWMTPDDSPAGNRA